MKKKRKLCSDCETERTLPICRHAGRTGGRKHNMKFKENKIELAVESLAAACGFDQGRWRGESGTEAFADLLFKALLEVNKVVARSHRQGLCYDTFPLLAWELRKRAVEYKAFLRNAPKGVY
jgi:hypothetical protein